MSFLQSLCSKYVTPQPGFDLPGINAVIAGYTDRANTRFLTAQGVKSLDTMESVSPDSLLGYYSCTKSITAMAILILYDRGKIELDAPAQAYLPELEDFGILQEGQVDENTGELLSAPVKPQTNITIRHLLLHMSGFAYLMTNSDYYQIFSKKQLFVPSRSLFKPNIMPLVFEPGSDWVYGHSYDWLGLIVEKVSGMKLSDFMKQNIFRKAGMSSCTFQVHNTTNLVRLHDKTDNHIKVFTGPPPIPLTSEIDMGGHGCYGTADDYLKFLRVWLNYGTSPDTGLEVVSEAVVRYALDNHLPVGQSTNFAVPFLHPNDGYSLIGCGKSAHDLPTGRPAGSLYWAGLANLYFWIDVKNGCAGLWANQIMPFMEPTCVRGFKEFEAAVYEDFHGVKRVKDEHGRSSSKRF